MKNEKNFIAFITSIGLVFYGAFLLCESLFHLSDFRLYVTIFFGWYGALHLLRYLFSENKKEYNPLLEGILGVLFSCVGIFYNYVEDPQNFSFAILLYALLLCFIKLKKADYFHDRKSKFWLIEVASLIFFLLLSILISMNLKFSENVLFIILGFYSFFIGVFEFFEILFFQLTKGKLK